MDEVEKGRKKVAQTAISALCLETGFMTVEKGALDALGHLLECYLHHVGRRAKNYCELASRTAPTMSDVELALVDVGTDMNSVTDHAKRQHRRHLPKQVRTYPPPQRRVLQVGTKKNRPTHIPPHLPAFPDPHTYIRTPTFTPPTNDYRTVREKLATQKRNSRKGLSKLLAKTRDSHPIAGDSDKYGNYSVVSCPSPSSPLYLQALMPTPEDNTESSAADESTSDSSPSPTKPSSNATNTASKTSTTKPIEHDSKAETTTSLQDFYENPFMKPPKRIRLKLL